MERKIDSVVNLNFWLMIFLLINSALRISYESYQELAIRFIIIIICLVGAKLLQNKVTNLFYKNGIKIIFKWVLIITLWWLLIKLITPNNVYFSSISVIFCLLMFFSQYQGYFYRKIDQERFPFYSLILPLLIIIISFLILIYFKEYQKAISSLIFTTVLYSSFKLKKIVRWRNIFIFLVILAATSFISYLYNSGLIYKINVNINYNPSINMSAFGIGIGKSVLTHDFDFTYNSVNVLRLFVDEVGFIGVLYANVSAVLLIVFLFKTQRVLSNCKESYRLLCLGITWSVLSEVIIYNLVVLNIVSMENVVNPLLALNIEYIWWNLGFGVIRGLLNRNETLRLLSHLQIKSI